MTRSRIVIAAALAVAVLALAVAFGLAREPAQDAGVPRETAPATLVPRPRPPASTLAQLGLSGAQRARIAALGARERGRIEGLERALAATERDLRVAELAQPFDGALVNRLVARRAELAAYLRGTESRVVSEIAGFLTPDQQRLFAELRVGANPGPRVRALPARRRLPEAAAFEPRSDAPGKRRGSPAI